MTDKSTMESAMKRAVHQLRESHMWSLSRVISCSENLPLCDGTGNDFNVKLEQCVEHVCSDLTSLRRSIELLRKNVLALEEKLVVCKSVFDSVRDTISNYDCDTGNLGEFLPIRDDAGVTALSERIDHISDYAMRNIQHRDSIIRALMAEIEHREQKMTAHFDQIVSNLERERDTEIAQLKVCACILDKIRMFYNFHFQDSLSAASATAHNLSDKLQTMEMQMCRSNRQKEEIEKELRHRISPEEYEALFRVSDRSYVEATRGKYIADVHLQSNESDSYVDDFDDMSSCRGWGSVGQAGQGTSVIGNSSPSRLKLQLDVSETLNISDITNGMASVTSNGLSISIDDGGGVRHSQPNSRRSRGASVSLNKKGHGPFTSPAGGTRTIAYKMTSPPKKHPNARVNDVLLQQAPTVPHSAHVMNQDSIIDDT